MAHVTDAAFRRLIATYGKPDVMVTEFVSCDGLCSRGREKLLVDLRYTEAERPIVAQVFGARPELFYQAALLIRELGFDGIDINMGCPDRNVEKQGAGAALMKNPGLASRIIRETARGAGKLPVSVKTRIGYHTDSVHEWIPALLNEGLAALTIHARTRNEMSDVPARWDAISRAVEIRDKSGSQTLILGNGDVRTVAEAEARARKTGADGIMIGRGVFGNPWLFNRDKNPANILVEERMRVMLEHARLFEKILGAEKNFSIMKKHFKAYVSGFEGAKELREKLMEAECADEVEKILRAHKFEV